MSSDHDPLDGTRKRLLWRASRRGIKEMDMVVGGFAARELPYMSGTELRIFESLLEIPDQQLLAFVTDQESVPPALDCKMLRSLLAFRPDLKHT